MQITFDIIFGLFPNYSSFDTGTHNIGIVIAIWTPVVMVSGHKEFFGFLFLFCDSSESREIGVF